MTDWVLCSERLPKTSGQYLVSRYGFEFDDEIDDFRIVPNKDYRYVEVAMFIRDLNIWDKNKCKNIYAWAELPKPCGC